ncbi:nitroreductase family protein [Candidatus Nitrosotalea okcheonensis]|uniref:Nitroreductase n=1 Tax=Candidatus Nitrosotalea okcheonensis TaxID=1903276 RepID=A0A2H1FCK6_9ARCH|nr:nitroreductase family protein [Candidatus Nitrosotalea okcheonensis]MDE1728338.1 nitroreductase family protein [Nitrososphaerota archaeon]MDE1831057.1 nitroreductase family protein [Nitrososphaerota archaeon]MDE1877269.1 nitroreductase family protein [Nitrososphaerota archaeon]SMH70494.1 Nitroreductase [Candidatus Nitrosotalea okcheonensis]
MIDPEVQKTRNMTFEINHVIVNRWSPRSFVPYDIDDADLFSLFESARWAPSSSNSQPWRFIYAKRNSENWNDFFNLLIDFNKQWCADAAALVVVVSRKNFENNEKPSITHQFDTGAAWENLAIQAVSQGLATHAMAGFDYDKARKTLQVPDNYEVMAMVAIGKRGSKEKLSPELQAREIPNTRKPLSEIVMDGKFGNRPKSL